MTDQITQRLVVVTDGHWGEDPNDFGYGEGEWDETHDDALTRINAVHDEREIDYLVHNGDIAESDPDDEDMTPHDAHEEVIEHFFDELPSGIEWHVVNGNHDYVTESEWQSLYGQDFQHAFDINDSYGGICTNTGGPVEDSDYSAADAGWLEDQIDSFNNEGRRSIVFQHVAPFTDDQFGIDMPDVRDQIGRDEVVCCFLGHNHGRNTLMTVEAGRYIYASRIGGQEHTPNIDAYGIRVFDLY